MIKNIIFDWSGTLADDLEAVYSAAMRIFAEFGAEKIPLEQFRQEFKLPFMDFYERYALKMTREQNSVLFSKFYDDSEVGIFPGVPETLKQLAGRGIKISMLSTGLHDSITKLLKKYGIEKYVTNTIITTYDKRDAVEELIERNSFELQETAFVGDMEHDIETAKKAGVTSIAVTYGYTPAAFLEKARPDYLINDIREILEVIKN